MKDPYLIRILASDKDRFENYLLLHNATQRIEPTSNGLAHTLLYTVNMDTSTALSIKLSFKIKTFINLNKLPWYQTQTA